MIEDCLFTIQKEQVDVVVFDIGVLENGTIIPRHMDERHFVNIKSAYTALIEDKIPNYLCNKFFKAIAWKEIRLKENTDLLICSECQKQICPDCATEDFDGNVYCQECYDKKDGEML